VRRDGVREPYFLIKRKRNILATRRDKGDLVEWAREIEFSVQAIERSA
jgi:hypothetical protein